MRTSVLLQFCSILTAASPQFFPYSVLLWFFFYPNSGSHSSLFKIARDLGDRCARLVTWFVVLVLWFGVLLFFCFFFFFNLSMEEAVL